MAATPSGSPLPDSRNGSNNHDHDHVALKRAYLSFLPPEQIIDICLRLELYAPIHVRSTVWPVDLAAAVAALQGKASKDRPSVVADSPTQPPEPEAGPSKPPDASSNSATHLSAQDHDRENTTTPNPVPSPVAIPPPTPIPDLKPPPFPYNLPPAPAPPSYPHQPYGGYAVPQVTYPRAPYYNIPHTSSHFPSFTTTAYQNGNSGPSQSPPLPSTSQGSMHTTVNFNAQQGVDLPSYEELLVEALQALPDGSTKGCAPRDLYAWMSEHYPLQDNFRASAGQALLKAHKRGRFEKLEDKKYRLSSSWSGGPTSTRTTRRPQTSSSTFVKPASNIPSPFTRTPLPANAIVPGELIAKDAATKAKENSDAWEAAQNILKAINFGALLNPPPDGQTGANAGPSSSGDGQPAANGLTLHSALQGSIDTTAFPPLAGPTQELSNEGRASLQAHLALLSAQLAEIAEDDDMAAIHGTTASAAPVTVDPIDTAMTGVEAGLSEAAGAFAARADVEMDANLSERQGNDDAVEPNAGQDEDGDADMEEVTINPS